MRRVLGRESLEREFGAANELARRLEKLGLIVPIAKNVGRGGELFYDLAVRALVDRARALVTAGYAMKDIALVFGRVEARTHERVVSVLASADLAERTRIERGRLEAWVARGLVSPWAEDEHDRLLFAVDVLPRVRAFGALETLGLTELMPDFAAGSLDVARVRARLVDVEAAVKTLGKSLPKMARRKGGRLRAPTRSAGGKRA